METKLPMSSNAADSKTCNVTLWTAPFGSINHQREHSTMSTTDTPRTDAIKTRLVNAFADFARGKEYAEVTAMLLSGILDEVGHLERQLSNAQSIIRDCMASMPVGNIRTHTPENLAGRIGDMATELASQSFELEACENALLGILNRYVDLANSGDAGFWNPEAEEVVISARRALA